MNVINQTDWKKDFGLEDRKPPYFFSSVEQLDNATVKVSHPLVIRRAFQQLGTEGILCQEHGPVIFSRHFLTSPVRLLKVMLPITGVESIICRFPFTNPLSMH
jgi:hypothetical protein